MRNFLFIFPALIALAGGSLVTIAIRAEETVDVIPGAALPKFLVGVLGVIIIFGSIGLVLELVDQQRRRSAAANGREAETRTPNSSEGRRQNPSASE